MFDEHDYNARQSTTASERIRTCSRTHDSVKEAPAVLRDGHEALREARHWVMLRTLRSSCARLMVVAVIRQDETRLYAASPQSGPSFPEPTSRRAVIQAQMLGKCTCAVDACFSARPLSIRASHGYLHSRQANLKSHGKLDAGAAQLVAELQTGSLQTGRSYAHASTAS